MTDQSYRVVSCEGGDQVGKADAILNLRNQLIKKSIPVTYSSFPIYATPLGTTIRMVLKEGFDDSQMDRFERIGVKMSLYSLNRLEFLDVLLSSDIYTKTLTILDRSSFSSAVSIAYAMCTDPQLQMEDSEELVNLALELDSFMIEKLNLSKCVLELVSESCNWDDIRGANRDLHEHSDIQMRSNEIYKIYARKIGDGWSQIVTKDANGWRKREEILKHVVERIEKSFGEIKPNKWIKNREVGAEEIIKSLYPDSIVEKKDLEVYKRSLFENDKDTMYEYACKVGLSVAGSCKSVKFQNQGVKSAFKKIVRKYPSIYDVLRQYAGENYVKRLQEGLK